MARNRAACTAMRYLLGFRRPAFAASSPAGVAACVAGLDGTDTPRLPWWPPLASLEQGAACGGLGHPGAGLCLRAWSGPGIAHFSSSTKISTIGL